MDDTKDVETIQNLINDMPPCVAEIKEIFGEFYGAIQNPKTYGSFFKSLVDTQQLHEIHFDHLNTGNKHYYYSIKGGTELFNKIPNAEKLRRRQS